ncbi:ATP-binding protein [Treponema pedis]|uniref:ATP-binding protein n=1 Tax=Treponema pedis TaxID=409322 RepID=UPI0003F92AAD|nr:ATP-binding protein [Treponema pedis]
MLKARLKEIYLSQIKGLEFADNGVYREALNDMPKLKTHALVISGVRRCGKSTLLRQFIKKIGSPFFYLNFDDLRLLEFSVPDYALLDELIDEAGVPLIFFDEIQAAKNWELYIRQKLDEGFQVVLTGSNASLLSRELGTKLTGRHIVKELFPFSYSEYLRFSKRKNTYKSFQEYFQSGGFPEYLKLKAPEILTQLQKDILYRDIAVRYGVSDEHSLQSLYVFLASNVGSLISPSKLKTVAGVKSHTTVLEYFSYFENSYLLSMVPKFAWSQKAQSLAPKKVYLTDIGFIRTAGFLFSENAGHILENFVFNELRRKYGAADDKQIYYFTDNDCECDFVVNPAFAPQCIQVCAKLDNENGEREIRGVLCAMEFFGLTEGLILTENSNDLFVQDKKKVRILPVWEYFGV